jgi:hypothetical protein
MLENDDGADFLPMKLAAVLVAASVAIALGVTYALALIDESATTEARACAARISETAAAEYADGCVDEEGCVLTGLTVPDCVRMITFGTVPVNGPEAHRTGTYTIQYKDGSNETCFTEALLGTGSPGPAYGGPLALYPGRYAVSISIRSVNGSIMALICPEAA